MFLTVTPELHKQMFSTVFEHFYESYPERGVAFTPRPNGCPNAPANTVLTTWSYFRLISGGKTRFDRARCEVHADYVQKG